MFATSNPASFVSTNTNASLYNRAALCIIYGKNIVDTKLL